MSYRVHNGWTLHESGPADAEHAVLMLPGGLCTAAFYDDVLADPRLAQAPIRFVATTVPGFGGTPPLADLRFESYSAAAAELAADLGCDVVVGHSMGANIAIEMLGAGQFNARPSCCRPRSRTKTSPRRWAFWIASAACPGWAAWAGGRCSS